MRRIVFVSVMDLCLMFLAVGTALASDEWEYKSKYVAEVKINDKLAVRVNPEFIFNDNISRFCEYNVDCGLDWKCRDWLVISPCLKLIEAKSGNEWKGEVRPDPDITLRWKGKNFKFDDRNRMEYRIREDRANVWRYRNRIRVKHPVKLTRLEITPFVSNEIFWALDAGEINENEFGGGLSLKFTKYIQVTIDYLWKSKKDDNWTNVNVLETELKASF